MIKRILTFFDKLEDKIRARLSRVPIIYSIVAAVGIILLWKGIWEAADYIPGLQSWGAILAGVIILLMSGLMVSFFIGDNIIISGLRREKKLADKTEAEIRADRAVVREVLEKLDHIEQDLHDMKPAEPSPAAQPPLLQDD